MSTKKQATKKQAAKKQAAKKQATKKQATKKKPAKKKPAKKKPAKKKPVKKATKKKPAKKKPAKEKATKKQPVKKKGTLVERAQALERGERGALEPLLIAWREVPSAALGDVIEGHAPPDDGVNRALAGLADLKSKQLIQQVQALEELPPDPRVAGALTELVARPPYTASSMKPMWRSLFAQLTRHHVDPRSLPRLRAVRLETTFGSTNMGGWMVEQLQQVVAELAARFADGAPRLPGEEELAACAPAPSTELAEEPAAPIEPSSSSASSAASATERAEQLLAQCLAAPDDDAPRLVYADLLAERGDGPRAELINLQIRRAREGGEPSEREQELIRKHAAKWLAPIVPVLKKDKWTFVRGFLDSCRIYPRKGKALELAGHPLWATVREVTLSETGDPAPIITHPVMRSLRVVRMWTYPRGLAGLLDSDAPVEELHHVFLPNVTRDPALWRALVGCTRLPRLRLLAMGGAQPDLAREIWSSGLGRPGLRLVFFTRGYQLSPWWRELARVDDPPPEVTVATQYAEFEVDRQRRLICTLGASNPAQGLGDLGMSLDLAGVGDEDGQLQALKGVELRAPVGGVTGEHHWGDYRTPAELLAAMEQRCAGLGMALEVREGVWETRYIGKHRVQL